MTAELKVGDVVRVECRCERCMKFGPPDPGEHNGPFIIREIDAKGNVIARAPFEMWRSWRVEDRIILKVVGRAPLDDAVYTATGAR